MKPAVLQNRFYADSNYDRELSPYSHCWVAIIWLACCGDKTLMWLQEAWENFVERKEYFIKAFGRWQPIGTYFIPKSSCALLRMWKEPLNKVRKLSPFWQLEKTNSCNSVLSVCSTTGHCAPHRDLQWRTHEARFRNSVFVATEWCWYEYHRWSSNMSWIWISFCLDIFYRSSNAYKITHVCTV